MRTNNIGMVGLAVMGRSLALNMADHGYKVGGYNRSYAVTEHMLETWPHENFTGYSTLEELITSLEKPRKVMLMVKAGKAVDAIIEPVETKRPMRKSERFWRLSQRVRRMVRPAVPTLEKTVPGTM